MSRSFDEEELETIVKRFDAVEWDKLLLTFKFDEVEEKMCDGEMGCFYNFYKDPSIWFTPLVIQFMRAALNADKDLAKETIKKTEQAIETIKSRKWWSDKDDNEITVGSFLAKKWTEKDIYSINKCTITIDDEKTANFSARALAVTSELYSLIALLQMISGSYMKGAYNLRKAWKSYENLHNLNEFIQNSDNNDLTILDDEAYMSHFLLGYGCFHFFWSLVPKSFQWIIKILGFTGDRDAGIHELYQCLNLGQRRASFAGLILLWIESFFYEDFSKGEQLFLQLTEKYENASLYYYLGGYLSRVQGNIDKALERFTMSYEMNDQFPEMENICKYEIGWWEYLKNDYETAKNLFEEFLEKHTSNTYKAWCYWQLGYCYFFLDQEDKAFECMQNVKTYKRKHYSWDEYWYRKSSEFIKNIPLLEMELNKIYNLIKCRKLKKAKKFLKDAEKEHDTTADPNNLAYVKYLWAKIAFYNDDREEARRYYEEIEDMQKEIKLEKYLVPYSKYRLLLLRIKDMESYDDDSHRVAQEDLDYIVKIVKEINKMSGYDFEKPLVRKIERVKDYFKEAYGVKF